MEKLARVRTAHLASYSDPIRVELGDALSLDGREDDWDGHRWLWAVSTDGREGWVPDNLIDEHLRVPVARFGYSAIELTCDVGENVQILCETHGWAWCRNEKGGEGWIPQRCLKKSKRLTSGIG